MSLFIGFIVYLVVVISSKSQELIADNYYEQDQNYQSEMESKDIAKKYGRPVQLNVGKDAIAVNFTAKPSYDSLKLYFFRPNSASNDVTFEIDEMPYQIPLKMLKKGVYNVRSTYIIAGEKAQQDTTIRIQ